MDDLIPIGGKKKKPTKAEVTLLDEDSFDGDFDMLLGGGDSSASKSKKSKKSSTKKKKKVSEKSWMVLF